LLGIKVGGLELVRRKRGEGRWEGGREERGGEGREVMGWAYDILVIWSCGLQFRVWHLGGSFVFAIQIDSDRSNVVIMYDLR
jgi:hypothetical protein